MKKIRNHILNKFNLWLGSIIALLTGAATGCDMACYYGPEPVSYGVEGNIQDKEKAPLESMQVVIDCHRSDEWKDTIYSNKDGRFNVPYYYEAYPQQVTITVNDTANVYESQTETKPFIKEELQQKPSPGWGGGMKYKYLEFNVTLTKKKSATTEE